MRYLGIKNDPSERKRQDAIINRIASGDSSALNVSADSPKRNIATNAAIASGLGASVGSSIVLPNVHARYNKARKIQSSVDTLAKSIGRKIKPELLTRRRALWVATKGRGGRIASVIALPTIAAGMISGTANALHNRKIDKLRSREKIASSIDKISSLTGMGPVGDMVLLNQMHVNDNAINKRDEAIRNKVILDHVMKKYTTQDGILAVPESVSQRLQNMGIIGKPINPNSKESKDFWKKMSRNF